MADITPALSVPSGLSADMPGVEAGGATRADWALVEGLRAGSGDAYEALIQRFQHPVFNLLSRLLDDPADAADALQEVFLKVFRKVGAFQQKSSLKTWIYRIAVNEAYNFRRSSSRHRSYEIALDGNDDFSYSNTVPDTAPTPFDLVSGAETVRLINEALQELSPAFRSAVILRDQEELSYEEIAEVLDVNLGTVKSRILRGREALREKLAAKLDRGWQVRVTESRGAA